MDYDKICENEKNTIQAIIKLPKKYPYAKALLCYVVIERILKAYIVNNRQNKNLFDKEKYSKHEHLFKNETEEKLVNYITTKMTLGNVEKLLKLSNKYSKNRNEVVHSNRYLTGNYLLNYPNRQTVSKCYLKRAYQDLNSVLEKYSNLRIKIIRSNRIKII